MNTCDNWDEKYRNDPRSNEDLFALVLAKDPDADDDEYWHPMGSLQHRLPEVLERVSELLRSGNEKAREAAGTIWGQSRRATKWDVKQCVAILSDAVSRELAAPPLAAMLHALGQLHDERIVPIVTAFSHHSNSDARYALTHALAGHDNPDAIHTLIELSADSDEDVRNWATFNLGSQIDTDTSAIRDALAARLNESDDEIRGEAIVGLARRGDARCIGSLMNIFDRPKADELRDWVLVLETVNAVAESVANSPEAVWLPILLRAKQLGIGDQTGIQAAIAKCDPNGTIGQLN
jgi:hypothetical protein